MFQPRAVLILLTVTTALALLTGCTPNLHVALAPENVALLDDVDCESLVIEDDISVKVIRSTAGQGWGLIGAIADKSATKKRSARAEELVPPLLDQTPDVDFRRQFADALSYTVSDIPWLNVDEVLPTATLATAEKLKAITSPLLRLRTLYTLTPDCCHFTINTSAWIWLPDEDKAIFWGRYFYVSDPIGDVVEEDAVAMWAENGAAAYREAVSAGIAEVMKMVRFDLPPDGELPDIKTGNWEKLSIRDVQTGKKLKWTCDVLDDSGDRLVLREKGGNMFSMPESVTAVAAPVSDVSDDF